MKIDVLDHGFVRLVETWGKGDAGEPEAGIIEAARQSTQGSFRGWEKDAKLLSFLFLNKPPHATPFEFAGMVIEVRAPIFVFREWHRHRQQSYNEMSARYAPLPDVNYVPTVERIMMSGGKNKQAGAIHGAAEISKETAMQFQEGLEEVYDLFSAHYQMYLDAGIPKELARCGMPVGRYSQMRASTSLRNWLGFLTLRMDPGAQWEIRQFANAVGQIIEQQFPRTWALFAHPPDDATGFNVAPTRYSAHGRETIDRIRDDLGDDQFVAYCQGTAFKYEDRAGLKGDADEDRMKARWYREMANHVVHGTPDPRAYRKDFEPYKRNSS